MHVCYILAGSVQCPGQLGAEEWLKNGSQDTKLLYCTLLLLYYTTALALHCIALSFTALHCYTLSFTVIHFSRLSCTALLRIKLRQETGPGTVSYGHRIVELITSKLSKCHNQTQTVKLPKYHTFILSHQISDCHSAHRLAVGPPALGQTKSFSGQPRFLLAAMIGPAGRSRVFSIVSGPLLDSKALCRQLRVVLQRYCNKYFSWGKKTKSQNEIFCLGPPTYTFFLKIIIFFLFNSLLWEKLIFKFFFWVSLLFFTTFFSDHICWILFWEFVWLLFFSKISI